MFSIQEDVETDKIENVQLRQLELRTVCAKFTPRSAPIPASATLPPPCRHHSGRHKRSRLLTPPLHAPALARPVPYSPRDRILPSRTTRRIPFPQTTLNPKQRTSTSHLSFLHSHPAVLNYSGCTISTSTGLTTVSGPRAGAHSLAGMVCMFWWLVRQAETLTNLHIILHSTTADPRGCGC